MQLCWSLFVSLTLAWSPSGGGAPPSCCGSIIPGYAAQDAHAVFRQASGDEEEAADADEESEKKPEWDVENPPLPFHDVAIDTDEGTWMNVDVSPDGSEIAFDLLGDIYTMPIAGGEATALTAS